MKVNEPILLKGEFADAAKFIPLPPITGKWPFHLDIKDVEPKVDLRQPEMVFHVVGDTGSAKDLSFQRLLALQLIKQARSADSPPQFLYHLGDIVYDHGEAHEYPAQFFRPFEDYPGPVFSIPGNHDAEINPLCDEPYDSLSAYRQVFCDSRQREIPFSEGSQRKSMIQPNIYWTLNTPLATIIGLYGNVAKFGLITEDQRFWFVEELKKAALDQGEKALIVCLHQSPFSADTNHGSSEPMIRFLEGAFEEAGVMPDLVMGGHVHNYQRFLKQYPDGPSVVYVVAGAGGYATLHSIANDDDPAIRYDRQLMGNIRLENSCTAQYGFLKMKVRREQEGLCLIGEYYTIPQDARHDRDFDATLYDRFEILIDHKEMAFAR
jgi:hypothetical protein